MNKNTHENSVHNIHKFSFTGENYVARRQTEYRHEGNLGRMVPLKYHPEPRSLRARKNVSNCRWTCGPVVLKGVRRSDSNMRLSGKARRTRGEFSVQLRYQGSARHMRHHLLREVNSRYNCVIRGVPATCATTFSGWTGETRSRGWLQFPGTGEGAWSVRINY